MAVPAPNTDLEYAALTMEKSDFILANGLTYVNPKDPGPTPSTTSSVSISTRTTRSATVSITDTEP